MDLRESRFSDNSGLDEGCKLAFAAPSDLSSKRETCTYNFSVANNLITFHKELNISVCCINFAYPSVSCRSDRRYQLFFKNPFVLPTQIINSRNISLQGS